MLPACAMKADMWPTEPFTTISSPRSAMPQRADALPSMTSSPPQPVAPADCEASPFTCTRPDIMFSARPVPALPFTGRCARLFMPAQ